MRNLRNTRCQSVSFGDSHPITAIAHDLDNVVVAIGPSEANPTIALKLLPEDATSLDAAQHIASWDVVGTDSILDLHCFADTQTISLVLANGDIVIVRQDPQPGEELIEIVGSVDAGVSAASWSPDEELLAVTTKADTVLFMTRDFDPTANITLSGEDVKVSNHVSVGWGKKETQFKGRGVAKTLRDPTMPEHVDEGTLSPVDDGSVSISWRGDGQYVAMNSVLASEPRRRVIRVYSREGVLESVSEPVNGLEGALSWKPSGQILAGVQRRADETCQVVFFERNGLRHGEFDLRLSKDECESIGRNMDLSWNVDSTVLAVSMADRVQLWTMGNYYYYLKQEIRFDSSRPGGMVTSKWHPEKPLQLNCSSGAELRMLSYSLVVSRGSVEPPNDLGLVAVIDGKTLKITPLRVANVPPPMALDEIDVSTAITEASFSNDGSKIMVRHGEQVSTFACDYMAKPMKRAALVGTEDLSPELRLSTEQPNSSLQVGEGDFTLSENGVLHRGGSPLPVRCTSFVVTASHLIYTTSNHLLKFVHLQEDEELQIPLDEPEKDERCRNIERGAKIVTVMPSTFALVLQMPRGNLETIFPRALVLAGIRNSIGNRDYKKAFLICRTHRVDMNILHDYAPEQFMRDTDVFLKQLKKVAYVDLFLSSLSEENVAETIYKETLTTVMDKPLTAGAQNGQGALPTSKVNRICDAMLAALRSQPTPALQNIITAHVCKSPPDLEAGLSLVSDLRIQQKQAQLESAVEHICFLADVNKLYDTALGLYDLDVALLVAQQSQKDPREYLPYLQGLHDMQPLRQRFAIDNDLKRYRKALSHLHTLEVFDELKAYMSKHELYSAAIEIYRYENVKLTELMRLYADHLSSRNRYKEAGIAYEYVQDYASAYEAYRGASLWQECLATAELVPLGDEELSALATDLADALEEGKDFSAAATVHLEYLCDLEGAAKMLCKGYHFSEAIRIIAKHKKPELLRSVIDPGLIEASASMTELLAEMKSQVHAQVPRLRELRQKKAEDPMAFLDGADGDDGDIPDNLSLAPTDTTAGGTFMTRYTNRSTGTLATNATRKTSKNRRREERKRARGKKGTVYEEEYLVNSISRLMERLNSVIEDLARLVESLMRRAMRERAVAVEVAAQDVVEACRDSLEEVYGVPEHGGGRTTEEQQAVDGEVHNRPGGGEGVLYETLAASGHKPVAPVLKAFERLSLLS
ncbi:hypothetical protein LTR36_005200 [Oleoguttula mirabilis]|uniref:Elongator complex protein 1 n=1 Tax=Oleoguttula mirabilis TaxID=1507867 RepID=A0AAV9JVY7_9PEZI|nr:hypothetical protein LTR36_005200 [Oleoguttula mirabilis]